MEGKGPQAVVSSVETRRQIVAVVDDDLSVGRAVGRLLKTAGFDATAFRSAQEFLGDSCRADVACLIVDLKMPGMDGLELQARMNTSGSSVPTVFITAHEDPASEAQALAGGALAFLHKPFDDTTLLEAVQRALKVSGKTAWAG